MILRTVSESSTTITAGAAAARRGLRRLDDRRGARARLRGASCTGFMISTIAPSASTVAPATPGDARELRPDVLDDDFLVADQLVDVQRDALDAAAQQQHRVVGLDLGRARRAEQAAQRVQRIDAVLEVDALLPRRARPARPPSGAAPAPPSPRRSPRTVDPARTSTTCVTASVSGR